MRRCAGAKHALAEEMCFPAELWARAVDYLGDWFDKANAVISSFNLGQAVTEIVPVVFPAAQKCGPLFLVKLDKTVNRLISKQSL